MKSPGCSKWVQSVLKNCRMPDPLLIPLPLDFQLSDASFAALVNCSLNLGADEGVGADFVNCVRQRWRARKGAVA